MSPPNKVLLHFSCPPAVFSSCGHIPCTHFDRILVSIGCYSYKVIYDMVKPFLTKKCVFFSLFGAKKCTKCAQKVVKCLIISQF